MGKVRKPYAKGKGPIVRKPFVGDPATYGVPANPEPTTARGRRRKNKEAA